MVSEVFCNFQIAIKAWHFLTFFVFTFHILYTLVFSDRAGNQTDYE